MYSYLKDSDDIQGHPVIIRDMANMLKTQIEIQLFAWHYRHFFKPTLSLKHLAGLFSALRVKFGHASSARKRVRKCFRHLNFTDRVKVGVSNLVLRLVFTAPSSDSHAGPVSNLITTDRAAVSEVSLLESSEDNYNKFVESSVGKLAYHTYNKQRITGVSTSNRIIAALMKSSPKPSTYDEPMYADPLSTAIINQNVNQSNICRIIITQLLSTGCDLHKICQKKLSFKTDFHT